MVTTRDCSNNPVSYNFKTKVVEFVWREVKFADTNQNIFGAITKSFNLINWPELSSTSK